jgi:CheY-like chemotaxis protein
VSTPKPRLAPEGEPFAPDLSDALCDLLTRELADAVLFNALRMADTSVVPNDPAGFVLFVLGSLDVAVERCAGRVAADDLLTRVQPLLSRARAQVVTSASAPSSDVAPRSYPALPAIDEPVIGVDESGVHSLPEDWRPLPLQDFPSHDSASHDLASHDLALEDPASDPTLLIASADAVARNDLRRLLEAAGYRVVAAPDGHVALALCVRYEPTLVITDLEMPRVTGKELLSSIKLALAKRAPPVIMLTEVPLAPVSGVLEQVAKPVSPRAILDLVHDALGQ